MPVCAKIADERKRSMISERMKLWWSLCVPCIYTHTVTAGDSGLHGCVVSFVGLAVSRVISSCFVDSDRCDLKRDEASSQTDNGS